jgi:hypothetical protein
MKPEICSTRNFENPALSLPLEKRHPWHLYRWLLLFSLLFLVLSSRMEVL